MRQRNRVPVCVASLLFTFVVLCTLPNGTSKAADTSQGDELVAEYFRHQSELLTDRAFSEIETLEDWTSRREEYRRQLLEMLGLDPLPERTPLQPTVTGTVEENGVIVERLQFQSLPGLYVTGNLYRPAEQDGPLPTILYVCGHGRELENGVSLGNKTHYQHHGGWFARNGYVCLTIDTIQLGEIEGIHHGTYREKMWWWNNRGYTPAGVEAWNCLRSLDYLQTRPEVDAERFGVTGRSGGGAYSWWIAAIDDRVKVAAPVAGITSLHNHVVDGTVEGHCDCMFMVNTYRWDYPMVAALVAPRPLLISNSDKDSIFPLDGVIDVHAKTRRIYELYDAADKIGLQITEGPHRDTQELRIHAFRWFNRFLRQDESLVETTATPLFEKKQLRVFDALPDDERVTSIHETFVPAVSVETDSLKNQSPSERAELIEKLRQHCFRGWPESHAKLETEVIHSPSTPGAWAIDYTSQRPYRLRMYVVNANPSGHVDITILNEDQWKDASALLATAFPDDFPGVRPNHEDFETLSKDKSVKVFVAPRGVGPTQWSTEERKRTHIRRRFMQLGQTAATMQIYDIHRALQALSEVSELANRPRSLLARSDAAVWTAYAVVLESGSFAQPFQQVTLNSLPERNRDAPDVLNVSRFIEIPQLIELLRPRVGEVAVNSSQ